MAAAPMACSAVMLELGGKSAAVLLPDANLDAALPASWRMAMANSGQTCVSQSRLIVPRSMLAAVEDRLAQLAQEWPLGDPRDEATRLGPVATRAQYEQVRRMTQQALSEGASLRFGGNDRPPGFARGWYCAPTLLGEVTPGMTLAQEEVFGPVLALMPYDSREQALELANATRYGLSGAVWAGDLDDAKAFARRMRTGQVILNGAAQNLATPFGGLANRVSAARTAASASRNALTTVPCTAPSPKGTDRPVSMCRPGSWSDHARRLVASAASCCPPSTIHHARTTTCLVPHP